MILPAIFAVKFLFINLILVTGKLSVLPLSGEVGVSRGVSSVELRNSWPPQHRCKIIGVVRRRPSAVCWQVLWPVVVSVEAKARAVSHVAIRVEECYRCEEASLLVTCILKQPDDTGDPFPVS